MAQSRLYLGCKKDGCNGVLCVSKTARHGAPFQCPRCLNKQKYCCDCEQLYINFRRHRQRGHELYEFQRKRQVLIRNDHGLFVASSDLFLQAPSTLIQSRKPNKKKAVPPLKREVKDHDMEEAMHEEAAYYPMMMMEEEDVPSGGESEGSECCGRSITSSCHAGPEERREEEVLDVVEVDDASDILVKLLHSTAGQGAGMMEAGPPTVASWTAQYLGTSTGPAAPPIHPLPLTKPEPSW